MNNISNFPDKDTVKQEAGHWLVRLDRGDLNSEEREALRRWMATSKFHQHYIQKLVQNWKDMNILSDLAELFPLRPVRNGARRSKSRYLTWIGAGATALVIVLTTVLIMRTGIEDVPPETYQTALGEQASFRLQDGTTITLNTNSLVNVDFKSSYRTVTLLRGEANFLVAENVNQPFIVYVGSGMVWAVGTQFNVRLLSDIVDVTVVEGTVKIFARVDFPIGQLPDLSMDSEASERSRTIVLDAGQSVRYGQEIEKPKIVTVGSIPDKLAWQQGSLIFKGEKLKDAIEEISRYTGIQLIIVDPTISDIPIGGRFKTNDIEALIASLDTSFNIRSEQVSANRIHLSAK